MTSNGKRPYPLGNRESGKATTLAMFLCIGAVLFYLRVGRAYFIVALGPIYDYTMLSILILTSLFAIGCVIHMLVLGEVSFREFRAKVQAEVARAERFAIEVAKELEIHERQCCMHNGSLSTVTIRALSTARRVSSALTERTRVLKQLIERHDQSAVCRAYSMLREPLRTDGDCCHQLIVGDPLPPIDEDELIPLLQALFCDIEHGLIHKNPVGVQNQPLVHEQSDLDESVRVRTPTIH